MEREEGEGKYAREIPFDQLRLINGVDRGVVDGDRSRGVRGKEVERGAKRKGKPCHEQANRALWVYAIKNVNICRRLVIGCKYGGGRVRGQMGRGGSRSSFVSLFIGMWNACACGKARAVSKPTLR